MNYVALYERKYTINNVDYKTSIMVELNNNSSSDVIAHSGMSNAIDYFNTLAGIDSDNGTVVCKYVTSNGEGGKPILKSSFAVNCVCKNVRGIANSFAVTEVNLTADTLEALKARIMYYAGNNDYFIPNISFTFESEDL